MVPAPGQGALAVQVRTDDERIRRIVTAVEDPATRLATAAERRVLTALEGGCQAPIGALATWTARRAPASRRNRGGTGRRASSAGHGGAGRSTASRRPARWAYRWPVRSRPRAHEASSRTRGRWPARETRRDRLGTPAGRRHAGREARRRFCARAARSGCPRHRDADHQHWSAAGSGALTDALERLASSRWIVFTSAEAVAATCTHPGWAEAWRRLFERPRIAAVGPATAARVRSFGLPCDLVPERSSGRDLAAAPGDM